MSMNFKAPENVILKPTITVFGIGGAGGNALSNMISSNLQGVNFIVANTDAQALEHSLCSNKIQLGVTVTKGLGAGAAPEVGAMAAEESSNEIRGYLEGSNMVFITAGMGGGTGTGASPIIAKIAKELGILTVAVVTMPFNFEGKHRMSTATAGLEELQKFVDTLIVIPNQNLFRIANERTTFADAFKMADDVLHAGVRGVTDLIIMPGLINLDFADIRAIMTEMGKAMMGTGEASGDDRAVKAAEAAISNPLLDHNSMKGARGVLINITGGDDMTLFEVDNAANRVREEVGEGNANIIFGSAFNAELNGVIRVSVVATGINATANSMAPQHQNASANIKPVNALQAAQQVNDEVFEPIVPEEVPNFHDYPLNAKSESGQEPVVTNQLREDIMQSVRLQDKIQSNNHNNLKQHNNVKPKQSLFSKMWHSLISNEKVNDDTVQDHISSNQSSDGINQSNIQDVPSFFSKKQE